MAGNAQEKILALFNKQPRARFTPAELQRRAGFERSDLQAVIDALAPALPRRPPGAAQEKSLRAARPAESPARPRPRPSRRLRLSHSRKTKTPKTFT